jgi:hypothetical protein
LPARSSEFINQHYLNREGFSRRCQLVPLFILATPATAGDVKRNTLLTCRLLYKKTYFGLVAASGQ